MKSQTKRPTLKHLLLIPIAAALCSSALMASAIQEKPDAVILVVNGESIPASEFYSRLQRVGAQDFIVTMNPVQMRPDLAGQIVMNNLINEHLLLQWASKTTNLPSDAEISGDVEKLKKQPNIIQLLTVGIITENDLRSEVRAERAHFNVATNSASLAPADALAYYKTHISNYTTPERWGIAIVRTSKPADLPKIQAAFAARKSFAEVVSLYSEDPRTKETGGQLPLINAKNNGLPSVIQTAAQTLKLGEVSAPIKLDVDPGPGKPKSSIWFFVKLTSKEAEVVHSFSEVKTQVERTALLERAGGYQAADKKIIDFRKQSVIKINIPGYQNLIADSKKP